MKIHGNGDDVTMSETTIHLGTQAMEENILEQPKPASISRTCRPRR